MSSNKFLFGNFRTFQTLEQNTVLVFVSIKELQEWKSVLSVFIIFMMSFFPQLLKVVKMCLHCSNLEVAAGVESVNMLLDIF